DRFVRFRHALRPPLHHRARHRGGQARHRHLRRGGGGPRRHRTGRRGGDRGRDRLGHRRMERGAGGDDGRGDRRALQLGGLRGARVLRGDALLRRDGGLGRAAAHAGLRAGATRAQRAGDHPGARLADHGRRVAVGAGGAGGRDPTGAGRGHRQGRPDRRHLYPDRVRAGADPDAPAGRRTRGGRAAGGV
ncbi:MAG: hypothetical protein AVDCRST_MAG68-1709, partial [uncultured Gemmatimonadetes bacterium]